jgi:hypothetical protein
MGPSTIDRSNFFCLTPGTDTETAVYYAEEAEALKAKQG